MKLSTLISLVICILLVACKSPEALYYDEIIANGFLPMKHPMAGVGTGTMIKGTPDNLMMIAPPSRCLPYTVDGKPSELRWQSDTAIGAKHYSATMKFDATLNSIVTSGTPAFKFNLKMDKIKNVDFEIKDAIIEMVDQIGLEDYYRNRMSESCIKYMTTNPFILNGLIATQMSFVFLDVFGGKIKLTVDDIQKIVDISMDVDWRIENGYKLVFTTPKYVGYHLGKLSIDDRGYVHVVSVKAEKNNFLWIDLDKPREEEEYFNSLAKGF